MTKKKTIFGYIKDFWDNADAGIWSIDTSDMTASELEGYRQELQRLEKQSRYRRIRNIRLIIYAVVLCLILGGIASIPGTVRYSQGPVTLVPMGKYQGEQEEGPRWNSGGYCKRESDHSFTMAFRKYDSYGIYDGFREVTGTICQEPETMNRKGRSSVSFSDGTTGTVWYDKSDSLRWVYLKVEYKDNVYGYSWCSADEFDHYKK